MIESILPEAAIYAQLARFFLVLIIGVLVTRLVLMPGIARLMTSKDKVSVHSAQNIVGLLGLFTSFIIALQAAQLGNLVTVLGAITAALTVAIGFGMREQIGNVVSGFFIYTDNPYVKGDYISVEDVEGVVTDIKLRQTTLNGPSREKMMVPNGMITTKPLKNYTKGRKTLTNIVFKVDVSEASKFEEICLKACKDFEEVMEKPEPATELKDLEEDKITFKLSYWVKDSSDVKEIRRKISKIIVDKAVDKGFFAEEEKEES